MKRSWLLGAALLFLAFAAYGSMVPLQLRRIPIREGWRVFINTPFVPLAHASGTDFVSNTLLFMPIGFFLLGAAAPRGRARALVWLLPAAAVWVVAGVGI